MIAHRLQRLLFGGADPTVRGMRRKVTAAALLACTLVLASVLVGINLLNWNATVRRLDTELDYLEDTDGELSALLSDSDGSAPDYLMEVPYDTRYFVVTLDSEDAPIALNMDSIASVHDEGAVEMAQEAVAAGQPRGFAGSYRYRVVSTVGQTTVFFLYAYNDLAYFHSFLMASIAMGLIGLAVFILIVIPFSSAAIRPVEEAQKQQRRFVTDASHELRTPLSIIQSAVDVIEIENGESEWTESIHNQTKRLEGLTDKLVALAKADEGTDSLKLQDVDFSSLAMEVAEDFEAVSAAQGKPFTTDIQEGIVVRADAGMAGQIVSILLDNAFKHSPEGASVTFSVKGTRPGHAQILVANEAEGLAPGAHPELFDRFFKADPSRTYEGGHGIGLAVVKAAAKAHGGTAEAVSDGQALTISVEL